MSRKSRKKSGFRWALRQFHRVADEELNRQIAFLTLARSEVYRRGPVVTSEGIEDAVSEPRPPLAHMALIMVDFDRHIFAVEYSALLMSSEEWHKQLERRLDRAARKIGYTTRLRLEPVPPREQFEAQFKQFERVTRLRLTLRIPNPDITPTFERLFREMKEGGVREFSEDMRNVEGLNVSGNTLPRASLDMALSGYKKGTVRVTGLINGDFRTLEVGEEISRAEVDGVRDYIEGMAAGSNSPEVRKAMRAIIRKIDEVLGDDHANSRIGR